MTQARPIDLVITYDEDPAVAGDVAGHVHQVRAGQREMAAWEREPFGCSSTQAADRSAVLFFRYLAWRALWRTRQLPKVEGKSLTWEAWDAIVESVDPAVAQPPPVDPSSPDPSPAD